MKNDITYENRKFVHRPDLRVSHFEIGECTQKVLDKELTRPWNGRLYHTTDTNKFFYDWDGKRYELNWTGDSTATDEAITALNKLVANHSSTIGELKKALQQVKGLTQEQEDLLKNLGGMSDLVDKAQNAATNATTAANEVKNSLSNYLTQSDAENTYQPKGDYAEENHNHDDVYSKLNHTHDEYLTEHQSLEDYLKSSDAENTYQPKGDYATKEDLNGKADANHTHSEYLTEHQSLEGYATEEWVNDKGYLTEHQSLDDYATKEDLNGKADAEHTHDEYLTGSDVEGFVKSEDLPDFEEFAKKEDLPKVPTYVGGDFVSVSDDDSDNEFVISVDLSGKANVEHTHEQYLTEADLPDFLTDSDITDFVTEDDVKKMIEDSLDGSDEPIVIPTYIGSTYVNVNKTESENVNAVEVKLGNDEFIEGIEEITNDTDVPVEMDGLVTMSQVIDLINKKKSEEVETKDYIYVSAVKYAEGVTPPSIYSMNRFEIDEEILTNEIEFIAGKEKLGYLDDMDGEDGSSSVFAQVFSIEIPSGYSVSIKYADDFAAGGWSSQDLMPNPRGAVKQYGSVTYNCYQRKLSNVYADQLDGYESSYMKYKILIIKNN